MWRLDVNVRCLLHLLSTVVFEARSLTNLELISHGSWWAEELQESAFVQFSSFSSHPKQECLCLDFVWVLGIYTQALSLAQQILQWLNHIHSLENLIWPTNLQPFLYSFEAKTTPVSCIYALTVGKQLIKAVLSDHHIGEVGTVIVSFADREIGLRTWSHRIVSRPWANSLESVLCILGLLLCTQCLWCTFCVLPCQVKCLPLEGRAV